jgi:cell division protease FtsH
LSDAIGPIDYGSDQGDVFLGQQLMQSTHISEETSRAIEEEVRKLVQTGMDEARRVMQEHGDQWTAIAEGLLEYETLSGDEIDALLKGNPPERPDLDDEEIGPASAVPVIGKRKKKKKGPEGDFGADPEPA